MKSNPADTIFAQSTPPGVAALAVIRLSGPHVPGALEAMGVRPLPAHRVATLVKIYEPFLPQGAKPALLDRALVTYFAAPASFTGEDVAELSLHGGRAVVAGVLAALARIPGLRLAEPGEFTRRAFEHHKLDLTEAEAIADLIHAETSLQRAQALAQLGGGLRALYDDWRDRLIKIAAYLEVHLDFADEDVPADVFDRMRPALSDLACAMAAHLNDGGRGELVRDGIALVIVGAPNAGKSSLLNALVRREVAIVSDIPGTTRDVIDVHLDLGGVPVTVSDTAGLRPTEGDVHGIIEQIGIDRAHARAARADYKIALFDGTRAPDAATLALIDPVTWVVVNKIDLDPGLAPGPMTWHGHGAWGISIKAGAGLDLMLAEIAQKFQENFGRHESQSLTRARHRTAIDTAHQALVRGQAPDLPLELVAEECRTAINALGRLTGRVDVEDLLDVIFRDFCIGK
jgi:tRNA modification GTPase